MQPNFSGQTLGKYELRELLGEGGMGAVYRAYDHNLKREVAVKIINLAKNDTALRARFIREAETAASLEHNHIVRIYDYGVERDINYIVMQHLTGGALSDRMKQPSEEGRPRASLPEVALLLEQLASALDYAHAQGVIHRDIKPQNVMFNNQGQAFIVDFGIAKLLTGATNMTGTGMAMGTPSYMSPEQWTTDNIVPASDQYALAVMTYQLIAGRLPFEADTPMRVMYRHLNDQPTPLNTFRPDISADLLLVMDRALSKDPNQRFPNCTQFAQAFSSAVSAVSAGKTEFFSFKLARIRPSGVPYTPTPRQPSSAPATPASNLSLPVIPLTQQPTSGPSRNLLIGGLGALVVIGILAVLLLGNRGPSESDLRLTEVNSTLIAAGLATERIETRVAGVSLIATNTLEPTGEAESTPTNTDSPLLTATDTASPTATDAPTETATIAPTNTPTDTVTASVTPTPSATDTATSTASNTPTDTHTPSATNTATFTASVTFTPTPTASATLMAAVVTCQGNTLQVGCDAYVSFSGAPLRTTPTATSDIIIRLQRGDLVEVLGGPDGTWWQVSFNGRTGWVAISFLTSKNPGQSQPAAPVTCKENALQMGCDAYVSFTGAPLRTAPTVASDIVTRLQRGDRVAVVGGPDSLWWQVSFNGMTGWVSTNFLTSKNPGQSQAAAPVTCQQSALQVGCDAYVSFSGAPLRTTPTVASDTITRLQRGDLVSIVDGPDSLWWQVSFSGMTGWVSANFLTANDITIAPVRTVTIEPAARTNTSKHIITLPGDFQSELGCESDWMPECIVSQMTDPDNDRVYTFSTDRIPAGAWEVKVALDYSWDVNYGVDGAREGLNIPFDVPEAGDTVTFAFDSRTRRIRIDVNPK